MSGGPLIYIIAGEPSGDLLGARLMAALKERTGGAVRFAGIGGEGMAAEGLKSRVDIARLAIMGVIEVLPRAREIFRHVRETVSDILALSPDAVVTIDSSGFTWRVAQNLRKRGSRVLLIHYVAPMVWAWRAGRARRVARWYDHLMALLPFEPPYFTKVGLASTYVGHPVIENGADKGDGIGFRARHGIDPKAKLLVLLPGSRRGEVSRLMPVFARAVEILAARYPGLVVALPTIETVAKPVSEAVAGWSVPVIVLRGQREKYDAFAAGDVAAAASGTVALELAIARLPAIVAYRVSTLTSEVVRLIVKTKYAHLVNVLLGREAVPELIQQNCTPERVADAVSRLIDDPDARSAEISAYDEAMKALGAGDRSPASRAAELVLELIAARSPQRRS